MEIPKSRRRAARRSLVPVLAITFLLALAPLAADAATVTSAWNSSVTGSSGTVAFANLSYNGSVSAGGATAFGFQGTGSASGTVVNSCTAS